MSRKSITSQIVAHHQTEGISDQSVYHLELAEAFPHTLRGWSYVGPAEDSGHLLGQRGYIAVTSRDGHARVEELIRQVTAADREYRPGFAAARAEEAYNEQLDDEYEQWLTEGE